MSDDYGDQYDVATFRRRILSVSDSPLRRRQIERHVLSVDAPTVVDHLQSVAIGASRGDGEASEIVFAFAEFIGGAHDEELFALDALDLCARDKGHHAVSWMLLTPPPARSIDARALAQMQRRTQSLGFRKAQAMRPDPRALERLSLDEHWMVIEKLCINPRTSEGNVMTIVTRRPTVPLLIDTVAKCNRWYRRATVREAIVMNPYADTALCLRTLPTLSPRHWATIQHASQAHESVRAFAQYLCALRKSDDAKPGPDTIRETVH
jgi:hypothetical protein